MKANDIKLSRRKTGGGAVYQDLGNTCFSFLTPYAANDQLDYRSVNNSIIIDALSKMNIKAEVSGRNDLVVDGKKVYYLLFSFRDRRIGCILEAKTERERNHCIMVRLCFLLILRHCKNI